MYILVTHTVKVHDKRGFPHCYDIYLGVIYLLHIYSRIAWSIDCEAINNIFRHQLRSARSLVITSSVVHEIPTSCLKMLCQIWLYAVAQLVFLISIHYHPAEKREKLRVLDSRPEVFSVMRETYNNLCLDIHKARMINFVIN